MTCLNVVFDDTAIINILNLSLPFVLTADFKSVRGNKEVRDS